MCNKREIAALPTITVLRFEKNRSSGNVQKGQNFGLTLNIGPAFSDRFLAHLWGAYAIPLALSGVRCVSSVSTITTRNN